MQKYTLLTLIFLFAVSGYSQKSTLTGFIKDKTTKELLVGVSVYDAAGHGAATDIDGRYSIELEPGDYSFSYSYMGYDTQTISVHLEKGETKTQNIFLVSAALDLGVVVVSSGKFEQEIGELTVSMEVVQPELIENKNTTSIDQVLQQTPGVVIVNNEPQIRSGSGYSFGAGSRVMILVDDLPLLSGDAGRPSWGFLPVENVKQIEVIKGASSVLYGSAALSGVINIRTEYASDEPKTKANLYFGRYCDPQTEEGKYWDGNPLKSGMNFLHAQKFGNLGIVLSGSFVGDDGHLGPIIVDGDTASSAYNPFDVNRYASDTQGRISMNLRYQSKKTPGLSFGTNTSWLKGESLNALLWNGATEGLYQAYEGSATRTKQVIGTVDPFVEYLSPNGGKHSLKGRWQKLDNDNDNNQGNYSDVYFGEYQFQQGFDSIGIKDFYMTAGLTGTHVDGDSQLYIGSDSTGKNTADNYSAYLQLDKKFFGRLNISVGMRYEYFKINEETESKPVFRSGLSYKLGQATFLRASYGEGYRFPSIAEKYIRTFVGGINVYPNIDLKSESSWSTEFGIKQGLKFGEFKGYLDVAFFWQEYEDYIEYTFGQWGDIFNDPNFGLGFKSVNTGRSQVVGVDISLLGTMELGKFSLNTLLGYTYTEPITLTPNYEYANPTGNNVISYLSTSSDTTNNILKYRMQHLFRADLELGYGKTRLGVSCRYNSHMQNIDGIFEDFDENGLLESGMVQWREEHTTGDVIFDARISYEVNEHHKAALIVNNLLNREYALRPLSIEPPRLITIQYTVEI